MAYYAVANGRSKGVYNNWDSCKQQVHGFSGAKYRKFNTMEEAQAFAGNSSSSSSSSSYSLRSSYPDTQRTTTVCRTAPPHHTSSSSKNQNKVTKVYIDGAARGNGRAGVAKSGYGVYFGENDSRNKAVPLSKIESPQHYNPTNQRAELHAAADALSTIRNEVKSNPNSCGNYEILTDSKYTKQSLTEWSDKWRENGWRTSNGSSVSNRDIIEQARNTLDDINSTLASRGHEPVTFTHVRGHQGVHGNEQADRLANQGADHYDSYRHR